MEKMKHENERIIQFNFPVVHRNDYIQLNQVN